MLRTSLFVLLMLMLLFSSFLRSSLLVMLLKSLVICFNTSRTWLSGRRSKGRGLIEFIQGIHCRNNLRRHVFLGYHTITHT